MSPARRSRTGAGAGRSARHLASIPPSASAEEAAAIVAALERFMRATAPPPCAGAAGPEGWLQAALQEAVSAWPQAGERDPWINP